MSKNYFHEIIFSRLALGIFVLILFILVAFLKQPLPEFVNLEDDEPTSQSEVVSQNAVILPNGNVVIAEIADTQAERVKGLSGRDSLDQNQAMVFVFDQSGYYSFWMPDMNFPIDIVWVDENYQIVEIASNVEPMPELSLSELPGYINQEPAKYVIEFNAGFCEENDLAVGTELELT